MCKAHLAGINDLDLHIAKRRPVGIQARREDVAEAAVVPDQCALVVLDRYSVRRIALDDAAAIDRRDESPGPSIELTSWVAEANGAIIGSISMAGVDNETGRIERFSVASEWEADRRLARRLAHTAADFARDRGLLKLVIDVPEDLPGLPPEPAPPPARGRPKRSRA